MTTNGRRAGWTTVRLGGAVNEISTRIDNPSEAETDRFVGLEHFDSGELKIRRWGTTEDLISAMKLFKAGDTLFARRNAYLRRASMVDFDGVCSGDAIVLRPKESVIIGDLLPAILNSDTFWEYALSHAAGSMSKRVNIRNLLSYEFALPLIEEQKRIAELLWAADEAVEKYAALSDKITQYSEAVVESNFTAARLGGVLGDYCPPDGIRIGPFGSMLHAADYRPHGVPVVMPADIENGVIHEEKIAHVSNEKAEELEKYRLRENDILFSRRGDLTKRAFVQRYQSGWLCGTGTIRVRLRNGANARATYLAVTSDSVDRWLTRFSVGTTMPNLNAATIARIPLHLPDSSTAAALVSEIDGILSLAQLAKEHQKSISHVLRALTEAATVEGDAAHV